MSGQAITEKFEYKTDIITSYDGHEQRIKTRQYPRHFYSYDYPSMDCFQAQWLRGLGRLRQTDTYYIPMWHYPIRLREDYVLTESTSLYIEKGDMFALEDCEWIEIFFHDDVTQSEANIYRKIRFILDGELGFKEGFHRKLLKENTFIFALKRCSVQPFNNLEYQFSNGTIVTHNFEDLLLKPTSLHIPSKYITDYEDYPQRNRWHLPETIDNIELFTLSPTWADDNSITLGVEKATNRLDNETGQFWYDLKNKKSYDTYTRQIILINRPQINNMIRFFRRVCGRYKPFWLPSWVNDVEVLKDIPANDNFIYTYWPNISDFYANNTRKRKLCIFTKDWRYYIYDIMSYDKEALEDGTILGKIFLTTMAGVNINKSNILMCSFITLVRLDSDELQLNYESDVTANTTLIFREVDDLD